MSVIEEIDAPVFQLRLDALDVHATQLALHTLPNILFVVDVCRSSVRVGRLAARSQAAQRSPEAASKREGGHAAVDGGAPCQCGEKFGSA